MSGDLEDFLKRAAARRQAKAQQPSQPSARVPQTSGPSPPIQRPAVARQTPQYTDRRRERVVAGHEDDEPIVVAEVISNAPGAMAKRRKNVKDAKDKADQVVADAVTQLAELRKASGESDTPNLSFTGDARADLIRLLRIPGGIKQAILLREILDRPVDRW